MWGPDMKLRRSERNPLLFKSELTQSAKTAPYVAQEDKRALEFQNVYFNQKYYFHILISWRKPQL